NADGLAAGLVLDQITQLVPNGTMQFRVSYPVWVVRATDSAAVIQFDGISYHLFRDILAQASVHSVSVADTQFTAGGRTRQVFVSQRLNGSSARTAAQLADLDQLGNNNGPFDLGDFLAWVQPTGAPLTAQQRARVSAAKRKGESRGSGSGDGCWSRWHWAAPGA